MHTIKYRFDFVIRIVTLVILIASSIAPVGAQARSTITDPDNSSLPSNGGFIGSDFKLFLHLFSNRSTVQEVVTPSTETVTAEPSVGPTSTIEKTVEGTKETPTLFPTSDTPPTPTITSSPTPTTSTSPALVLTFSTDVKQAQAGQKVVFSFTVENKGTSPVDQIRFSNVLPDVFEYIDSSAPGVSFDAQTRELTWTGDQKDGTDSLLSNESFTFNYTVMIGSQVTDVQLVDTVNLTANGLDQPITAEAAVTLLSSDNY